MQLVQTTEYREVVQRMVQSCLTSLANESCSLVDFVWQRGIELDEDHFGVLSIPSGMLSNKLT